MNTQDMTHNEWLAARQKGIGGSDAGAILGLNKWRTPLDVYLDKTGQAAPIEDNAPMYWGRQLEDIVAQEYSIRTGNKIEEIKEILVHPKYDFVLANLDRNLIGRKGILECKTAARSFGWGEDGSDQVPESYLAQVMHYMAVTGSEFADVAVLIGGNDFRIYHIERDNEVIDMIMDRENTFWHEHVLAKVAPDPMNASDVNHLWPQDDGETDFASNVIIENIEEIKDIKQRISNLKKVETALTNQVKESMGELSGVTDSAGKILATWKTRKSMRLDTKRLKVEQPEVYNQYVVESSNRTFLTK